MYSKSAEQKTDSEHTEEGSSSSSGISAQQYEPVERPGTPIHENICSYCNGSANRQPVATQSRLRYCCPACVVEGIVHHHQIQFPIPGLQYACTKCNEVMAKDDLMNHMSLHDWKELRKCGHCGEKFVDMASLRRHYFYHNRYGTTVTEEDNPSDN